MRIAFLVRSLEYGGAERQLVALAIGLKARGDDVRVIALYGGGSLATQLRNSGVDVVDVGKRGRWDLLGFAARLDARHIGTFGRLAKGFLRYRTDNPRRAD